MKTKAYVKGLKTSLQSCACDPYELYGNQASDEFIKLFSIRPSNRNLPILSVTTEAGSLCETKVQ